MNKILYISMPLCFFLSLETSADLVPDNKTAYEITVLLADKILSGYTYETGAHQNKCSNAGEPVCKLLNLLTRTTKAFTDPARPDLIKLIQDVYLSFRLYDISGRSDDRKATMSGLANLLRALTPLLTDTEAAEARGFLQRIEDTGKP